MSGGGSQGSFETGALRFLYDDLKLKPAILCGSSVGSIIAAKLAEGDDPETGRRAIDEMEALWRSLTSNDDMWLAEPWLEKLRSQANWASELRGRAAENGTAGSQARVVLRMLSEVVRHPPETDGTLDALRQAMRARSLLSMQPVRELVENNIDVDRIVASGIMLRIGAVGLESGELRYITEHGDVQTRDGDPLDQPRVPLTEAVLASASIPLVFPPTKLNDEHYVDGGVREILPLELAFNRLGAGHIFAVVASTPGVEKVPDMGDKGLLELARRVTADIVPDETLRKEISPPRGWGKRVTVIAPQIDVHDALTVDRTLIAASIDYGYMRAADVLLEPRPGAGGHQHPDRRAAHGDPHARRPDQRSVHAVAGAPAARGRGDRARAEAHALRARPAHRPTPRSRCTPPARRLPLGSAQALRLTRSRT